MSDGHAERALRDNTPQLKDLWVARAFELAQRQCAVTHALTKLNLKWKARQNGGYCGHSRSDQPSAVIGSAITTPLLQRDAVGLEESYILVGNAPSAGLERFGV